MDLWAGKWRAMDLGPEAQARQVCKASGAHSAGDPDCSARPVHPSTKHRGLPRVPSSPRRCGGGGAACRLSGWPLRLEGGRESEQPAVTQQQACHSRKPREAQQREVASVTVLECRQAARWHHKTCSLCGPPESLCGGSPSSSELLPLLFSPSSSCSCTSSASLSPPLLARPCAAPHRRFRPASCRCCRCRLRGACCAGWRRL